MLKKWVKIACVEVRALLFPSPDFSDPGIERSVYERFAIPYTFKPQLSFAEALVAVAGALLRIFLGSLVFAIWGTYSLQAWAAITSNVWRVAAVLPLLLLFLLPMAAVMIGISALVRTISPRRS